VALEGKINIPFAYTIMCTHRMKRRGGEERVDLEDVAIVAEERKGLLLPTGDGSKDKLAEITQVEHGYGITVKARIGVALVILILVFVIMRGHSRRKEHDDTLESFTKYGPPFEPRRFESFVDKQRWYGVQERDLSWLLESNIPDVVFMGDGIIEGLVRIPLSKGKDSRITPEKEEVQRLWTKLFGMYKPVNLGLGGDRVSDLGWRLSHGLVTGEFTTDIPDEPAPPLLTDKLVLASISNKATLASDDPELGISPTVSSPPLSPSLPSPAVSPTTASLATSSSLGDSLTTSNSTASLSLSSQLPSVSSTLGGLSSLLTTASAGLGLATNTQADSHTNSLSESRKSAGAAGLKGQLTQGANSSQKASSLSGVFAWATGASENETASAGALENETVPVTPALKNGTTWEEVQGSKKRRLLSEDRPQPFDGLRLIVLHIGSNDLLLETPHNIASQIINIVLFLRTHAPKVSVLLMSILPQGTLTTEQMASPELYKSELWSDTNEYHAPTNAVNEKLRSLVHHPHLHPLRDIEERVDTLNGVRGSKKTTGVFHVDCGPAILHYDTANQTYLTRDVMNDFHYLTVEGYRRLGDCLKPIVDDIIALHHSG
jgi:hypothetical protein